MAAWRPVAGWEDLYEVNDQGQVRSLDRVTGDGRRIRGRVLKLRWRGKRLQAGLCREGHCSWRAVSHLVLESFVGPRPAGLLARHLDDDPSRNVPSNLAWGTYSDNTEDRVRNGRDRNGRKVVCVRGHRLIAPNLRATSPGRYCLACHRGHADLSNARRSSGSRLDLQEQSNRHYAEIMKAVA